MTNTQTPVLRETLHALLCETATAVANRLTDPATRRLRVMTSDESVTILITSPPDDAVGIAAQFRVHTERRGPDDWHSFEHRNIGYSVDGRSHVRLLRDAKEVEVTATPATQRLADAAVESVFGLMRSAVAELTATAPAGTCNIIVDPDDGDTNAD